MASLYASVAPQFTRELLSPGLRVGYTDVGGVWQFLAPSLIQRLPLRAIEWRNLMGVTKKIDQLPLHFVETSPSARELPLANIYLVKCEDLDSYKSVVRAPLAAWVDAMSSAKVEWLVLYVPLGTRPKAAGQPNPVYRKIFERLRTDFAHKKSVALGGTSGGLALQERVCKIDTLEGTSVLGQQQQHESQWTELLLRLRHCVMDAFQIKCFQYEEQLRVLDARRNAPGWDFGAFFLAKERLALMYQQMYLQDDAIRHLDELDAIFVNLNDAEKQAFQDDSKSSFTPQDPIFTESPLALNLQETQLRIASNRASARLISLYCFCRQIRTLYVMGSFPQLLERASTFIEGYLTELQEMAAESLLDWHQPFLWAVGACLEVTYACELSWSGRDDEWTASSVSVQVAQAIPVEEMSRALGNVLYLARRLLKGFAKATKARTTLRVSFGGVEHVGAAQAEDSRPWYQQLEQVLVAPEWQRNEICESYEQCLSEVSHLASMHFSQSGRHRFAVFLGGECARYHLSRGEYESASRLLRSLARQSEEDGWWTIFGACVRSLCRAELALGRSSQAVAACFSMLQVAQEAQVGVSKEEMEQLMHALVASLEEKSSDVQVDDGQPTEAKVNMGELFRPTVNVETSQTSDTALEHGDIRVTLGISNDFPAGVHLEKVRVCFSKASDSLRLPTQESSAIPTDETLANLDELVLDEEAKASLPGEGESSTERSPHPDHSSFREYKRSALSEPSLTNEANAKATLPAILLEEENVHLDEKTGVNLVFLHSGVPVGRYVCTAIECVLAGSTFRLLPARALTSASFEIAAKESTVQVTIDGAPLLMPRPLSSTESVRVAIAANDDAISNGTLELRAFKAGRRSSRGLFPVDFNDEMADDEAEDGEEDCGITFLGAQSHDLKSTEVSEGSERNREDACSTFTLALPELQRGGVLTYTVLLEVPAIEVESETDTEEDAAVITIAAKVRYQRGAAHSSTGTSTTETRNAESTFRVIQPLTNVVRLKRVGVSIFVAVSLTCNPLLPITLRGYKLLLPDQNEPPLSVLQDPNERVKDTVLRPRDCIHLAFTLGCSPGFDTTTTSECSLELLVDYGGDGSWQKTMAVPLSLLELQGKRYRIDVAPIDEPSVEFSSNEPVMFDVRVEEDESEPVEEDTPQLALSLNDSSQRDWILVGKERECFAFESATNNRRVFATQKKLMAVRTGQLQFPVFQLEADGREIPEARVHCQQRCRRLLVT